ncbi:hypothetical protein H0H87_005604, partial [Tephrocybe sp. NHM501043]
MRYRNAEGQHGLKMKSNFIGFHHIKGKHMGDQIAHAIAHLLEWAAIKSMNGGTVDKEGDGNDCMNAPPNLALHSLTLLAK